MTDNLKQPCSDLGKGGTLLPSVIQHVFCVLTNADSSPVSVVGAATVRLLADDAADEELPEIAPLCEDVAFISATSENQLLIRPYR